MNQNNNIKLDPQSLYNALLKRDEAYDGFAFVCVKTTKIYCRLSCAARKPLEQNVEFVTDIQSAQKKGYRACLRCKPDEIKKTYCSLTFKMLEILRQNPQKKWNTEEIKKLDIDESTLRRAFQRDFGLSFLKFAREYRLGSIISNLENGNNIIDAQLDAGFSSSSGFVDAIKKQIGLNPSQLKQTRVLNAKWLQSPIGPMLAIVDDDGLYLLEFSERKGLPSEIEAIKRKIAPICFRNHPYHLEVENQLEEYFSGKRHEFSIKIAQFGTEFEKKAWAALCAIPFGQSRSYTYQAEYINNPNAVRAIARANGANKIAIIIPCHRVIGADGSMTGYGGKIWRKEWLLNHEKKINQ